MTKNQLSDRNEQKEERKHHKAMVYFNKWLYIYLKIQLKSSYIIFIMIEKDFILINDKIGKTLIHYIFFLFQS